MGEIIDERIDERLILKLFCGFHICTYVYAYIFIEVCTCMQTAPVSKLKIDSIVF